MKEFEDIEKMLKESKLPDRDTSSVRHEAWKHILRSRKEKREKPLIARIPPIGWALASFILILLCIFFMILMYNSR